MSLLLFFGAGGTAPSIAMPAGSLAVTGHALSIGTPAIQLPAGSLAFTGRAPSNLARVLPIPSGGIFVVGYPLVGDGLRLTIAGVDRTMLYGWEIHAQANGRSVMRLQVRSMDGSYRPALDDEVIFTEDGVTLFGGQIEGLSEAGVGDGRSTGIVTTVLARDYNTLATRQYATHTIPAGTLKEALEELVTTIPNGVTLEPTQVDGPSLPALVFTDVKVDEALNQLATMTGYVWEITPTKKLRMYAPGTLTAPFDLTVPNCKAVGDILVEPTRDAYANRVIVRNDDVRSQADDVAEQATRGVWEMMVEASDNTPQAAADDLAAAILARSTPTLKKVRYRTRDAGLYPGQTQTITLARRNINNTFILTEIVLRADGVDGIMRDVTAIEGLVYQAGWRETYKRWNGSAVPMAGAIFGSATARRFAYFLGGSGVEAVRSSGPDWVPVSGGTTPGTGSVQVQVNTVARGTTSASVFVRLRAQDAGVSVKARLYDVTDSVACAGESAVVVGTTWQNVTFTATLTSGSHYYELQVLPGAADADVFGSGGYLE